MREDLQAMTGLWTEANRITQTQPGLQCASISRTLENARAAYARLRAPLNDVQLSCPREKIAAAPGSRQANSSKQDVNESALRDRLLLKKMTDSDFGSLPARSHKAW